LTNVIFNLATYASYIEPLREEISTIVEAEGWSKTSIEKMRKLDSFFKESHRVHGSPAGEVSRVENSNDESRTLNFSFLFLFLQSRLEDWW